MTSGDDRSLGPVIVIAALVLLVAGWAYFTATNRTEPQPQPGQAKPELRPVVRDEAPTPQRPAAAAAPAPARPAAEEESDASATGVGLSAERRRPSGSLLARMATDPAVQPTEQIPAVQPVLEATVEKFQTCWSDQAPAARAVNGKAFLTFTVGKGGIPNGPMLQYKGVDSQELADCMDRVVTTVRLPEAELGTRVFWPMVLGGEPGVATLGSLKAP